MSGVEAALRAAIAQLRMHADECRSDGLRTHAGTYDHAAGIVERIVEEHFGLPELHIDSGAPADMGRGNVIEHPRKPPHDDRPLSNDAQSAAREADAAIAKATGESA